jgi:hypothetical protein
MVIGSFIAILSSAIAELRAASDDTACCLLCASTFGVFEVVGSELGRVGRCWRRGDLSGMGGGGVEGGGDGAGPLSIGKLDDSSGGLGIGGLGSGGGLGLPVIVVAIIG